MLLQFSVGNYRSFKDKVLLNMIPAKSRIMKEHIITDSEGKKISALPIAVLYGANASGKTNLVNAIAFAQEFIVQGTRSDQAIKVIPYLLDPASETKPGHFEFVFKHENVLYTYGFLASKQSVHEEWLFAHFSTQESLIFERITKDQRANIRPGNRLISDTGSAKFINFVARGTRPNQLFLTEANDKNIALIKPVFNWFREHLHVIPPNSQYHALEIPAQEDRELLDYLAKLLIIADTGISSIHSESESLDADRHLTGLPEDLRTQVIESLGLKRFRQMLIQTPGSAFSVSRKKENDGADFKYTSLKTEHLRTDHSKILFEPADESDGTRRLMSLAPLLKDAWVRDRVFVIDELDRSLHSHISRLFLQLCILGVVEKQARGQFILTTHDTNLLDRSLLRRDEIWFLEKDRAGASHLTSLADYKISDGMNYENGYLNGRFGAIPFIGNIKELLK